MVMQVIVYQSVEYDQFKEYEVYLNKNLKQNKNCKYAKITVMQSFQLV